MEKERRTAAAAAAAAAWRRRRGRRTRRKRRRRVLASRPAELRREVVSALCFGWIAADAIPSSISLRCVSRYGPRPRRDRRKSFFSARPRNRADSPTRVTEGERARGEELSRGRPSARIFPFIPRDCKNCYSNSEIMSSVERRRGNNARPRRETEITRETVSI